MQNHIKLYIAYNSKYFSMTGMSVGVKNRILDTIRKKPMSLSALSRLLNVRRDFISGYLEAMRHEGEVELVSVGRSKVYSPKQNKIESKIAK